MAIRRSHQAKLAAKSIELSVAAPQVVAHRMARMVLAGPNLSDRDRKEFKRMVDEKHTAFVQAWSDMSRQALRANQAIATSMLRCFLSPFSYQKPSAAAVATQVQRALVDVLGKGLAPVHRKAVSNAKRLAKTKLR
jgi:hypothetical protein